MNPRKDAMPSFLDRFRSSITGVLSGFDRLVFRGHLRSLTYPRGMFSFLCDRHVLLKDFLPWAKERTDQVKADFAAEATAVGQEVEYLRSPSAKKEDLARRRQDERKIRTGTVASFSCVEPCRTWEVRKDRQAKRLVPAIGPGQCLHLYRYVDHAQFGFMHVRLQTWFPFTIQVCMNGREYLRRALERTGIPFEMRDNCFADIADWRRAQKLLDSMLDIDWIDVLDGFAHDVFPARRQVVGALRYQWSSFQSEWATDHAFVSTAALDAIYPALVRHAVTTSDTAAVLRFLSRPVTARGTAHGKLQAEVTTRLARRTEGICVKHHVGSNSVKTYNKQGSVYRAETTINDPTGFKVYRRAQGGGQSKDWRPLRASVVDLKRRAEVSQQVNDRLLAHQATVSTDQPLSDLVALTTKRVTWHGQRHRGLDLLGKDRLLVDMLADPAVALAGVRNAGLRERLKRHPDGRGKTDRQLSAMATRLLRLLRAHGIIRKQPKSHRYQLSESGTTIINAVKAALSASTAKLVNMAA
jgi:hypothetical protein